MMNGILLFKEPKKIPCIMFVGEKIQETSFDVDTLKTFILQQLLQITFLV